MTPEIGQFALILALVLAGAQAVTQLWGASRGDRTLMEIGRNATVLQALFVALAFGCLAAAYAANDFSVALVAAHSNSAQPLIYRLGATWGSHEGSMLLWVLILAVYGGAVALFGGTLRETMRARVLGVQGLLGAAFIGFLIFTSNPFSRLLPVPADGGELNPILQDPGLVFHPPILYLGYVGFSIAFSFAVAALIEGTVDEAWARWVRPWVLASWLCLTIGVSAGSLWAYYSLGWGGWWFWDPVENASFMPWLLGTALLHSALVLERRGALISWTILLAILTFSLSLVGTFLVRSGVLTSVHAFAIDARRGVYILAIIGIFTGSALALFAWRAPAMRTGALFAPLSVEGGITLNNLFLLCATATVFLGTFYPVFVQGIQPRRDHGRTALLQAHLHPDHSAAAAVGWAGPPDELASRRSERACPAGEMAGHDRTALRDRCGAPAGRRQVAQCARPGARRLADRIGDADPASALADGAVGPRSEP
jgi:cytochrome c-type biogenesis protein CcmF